MKKCTLEILDEVNCKFIDLETSDRRYLHNKSKIFNPALKFLPSVRMGRFDGKVAFSQLNGSCYINLLEPILEYLITQNYDIHVEDLRTYNRSFHFDPIDKNYFGDKVWPIGHQMEGQPIILRDHQVEAVNKFLQVNSGISSLPTSSGKSLLTAVLSKQVEKYGRSIVIVPNKDLITQTEKYYIDLGMDVGVYYGDRKDFFKTHTICTWQSLSKLKESPISIGLAEPITFQKFVQNVIAVIVDECHGLKGPMLSDIMCGSSMSSVPIRWAFTGTIPKEEFDRTHLTIAIGEIIHKLKTSDLQELGILSTCKVNILQLIDTKAFNDYPAELDYLVNDPDRLKFISSLIKDSSDSGNVLVLVGRKESGTLLESMIPGSIFLSGASKSSLRKEHYDMVANASNKVIIATSGIAAVGLDIPNLHHLFLLEIGKSFVKVIQSIGRILRTAKGKSIANVWDICSTCRFSKKHLTNRKKFYNEQEFPFTIEKINWQQ